jgi:hypothetical protein
MVGCGYARAVLPPCDGTETFLKIVDSALAPVAAAGVEPTRLLSGHAFKASALHFRMTDAVCVAACYPP